MVLLNNIELKEFFNKKYKLDNLREVKEIKKSYRKIVKILNEDKKTNK